MFGIILTSRGSPATRHRSELDRPAIFPLRQTKRPEDLKEPRPGRQVAKVPQHGPRAFDSKSLSSRKADIVRARRLLAVKLSYVTHPSFAGPNAHDAILTSSSEFGTPASDPVRESRDFDANCSRGDRIPSREREAHMFRKMNFLKFLAGRIRDRMDPDSPLPVDLDHLERLQIEALKLKNQIVEANLRLVVSVAKKRVRAGYDLLERISDGTFALMQATDRFDFSRGNRFSTYATWAIFNEFTRYDRRELRRRTRSVSLYMDSLAAPESESEQYEQDEVQDQRGATIERFLRRLNGREWSIIVKRTGIGGGPEQTLKQIGRGLGISKERVRQLEQRAYAKLRSFARLEAIEPSDF
jgi:RNA polymerase primary sigma factor